MRTNIVTLAVAFGLVCCANAAPRYSCFDPPAREDQTNPLGEGMEDIVEDECCEALVDESDILVERSVIWAPAKCNFGPGEVAISASFLCSAHNTDGCRFCRDSCDGIEGACVLCSGPPRSTTESPISSPLGSSSEDTPAPLGLFPETVAPFGLFPDTPAPTGDVVLTVAPTRTGEGLINTPSPIRDASVDTPAPITGASRGGRAPTTEVSSRTPAPVVESSFGIRAPITDLSVETPAPITSSSRGNRAPTTTASPDTPAPIPGASRGAPAPTGDRLVSTPAPIPQVSFDTPTPITGVNSNDGASALTPTPTSTEDASTNGITTASPTALATMTDDDSSGIMNNFRGRSSSGSGGSNYGDGSGAGSGSGISNNAGCDCLENMSSAEAFVLAAHGKSLACDPTCTDGSDLVWGVINCNYFALGQNCRACANNCRISGDGTWLDGDGVFCKPCSAIP